MTQKSEGYIDLEWTCPNCQSNNPGPQKTCQNCGSPQPTDVTFHLPGEMKLKTDEATAEIVAAGPDIHCPFCGARNRGDAETCTQCGGDLTGGTRRQAGQVVGAFSSAPGAQVTCSNCGAVNPASAQNCTQCGSPLLRAAAPTPQTTPAAPPRRLPLAALVVGLVVLVGLCILLSSLFKTETTTGSVQNVAWSRIIQIEAISDVLYKNVWREDIPAGARISDCSKQYSHTQSQPAPVATEVCGTSYVIDKGSGVGQVVKDCTYRVYKDRCNYTVQEWTPVDQAALQGAGLTARWPALNLQSGQRQGKQQEVYTIEFLSNDKILEYKTDDYATFARCQIGSQWNLEVSSSGKIVSISPIQ